MSDSNGPNEPLTGEPATHKGRFSCHLSESEPGPLVPGLGSSVHVYQINFPLLSVKQPSQVEDNSGLSPGPSATDTPDSDSDQPCDSDRESDTGFDNIETIESEIESDHDKDRLGLGVKRDGKLREAPTQIQTLEALTKLKAKLHPPRKTGRGYKDPELDSFVRKKMEGMQSMLHFYTISNSSTYKKWGASALQAAISVGCGRYCACQLAKLSRKFIEDRSIVPVNPYGNWNESMLVDEDLTSDISLYLQELGNNISARKVVDFLATPDIKDRHGITKSITERTARRYLNTLGYRWASPKKGQYADGHERLDVVWYRNHKFLPQWNEIKSLMTTWTKDSDLDNILEFNPVTGRCMIAWFHDESIFYAHNRRQKSWYHKDALAKPYAKGDGASLMVADFVSADFGWLESPDGKTARRVMRPGKNKDGYFTSDDIDAQAHAAMDILNLNEHFSEFDHTFFYDNAPSHQKRPEGSLSARHMPKFPSKPRSNWGIEVTNHDINGKPIYLPDGSFN